MAAAALPLQQLPRLQPYDIICGQNVACSHSGVFFQLYLVGFINMFVNDVLQNLTPFLGNQQYHEKILRLKQQMFEICLDVHYYTMFATYMQQQTMVHIDGRGGIPIFDLGFIQTPLQPTVAAADGTVLDCKILHLFIGGLAINMMSLLVWLPDITLEKLDRLPVYKSILPDARLVGEDITDDINIDSIRYTYAATSINFFSIGGTRSVSQELHRDVPPPGFTKLYAADITTTTPPVPPYNDPTPKFPINRIIWNNRNQVSSNVIYVSCFDADGHDIEFVLTDGVIGGKFRICDPANPYINFQEWRIDGIGGLRNIYVQYIVHYIGGNGWQARNDQKCQLIIMKPGQIVPTPSDNLIRRIKEATVQIGGVKRQNKSKRRRQKRSNKKIKSRRRHNVKRSYRRNRFY